MSDQEFERLYAQEAQGLFAFLTYRTGDRALAEDLLADAFERVLRAKYDRRRGSAKTWLYSIALNVLRDHMPRGAAERRADAEEPDEVPRAAVMAAEVRDELARALEVLPAEERGVISLRFGPGLTVPEIAAVLGEPLTKIEGRVYRALRKL